VLDVRREVSVILSTVTALNRNTSFNSVKDVLRASMEAPSTGFLGWVADDGFEENMKHMTSELEEWRKQRLPAKESPETSKYIAGAGTILGWWQSITAGSACMLILPFIPKYILPQTLHVMMDVKEDVELMSSATVMLKYLSNAPYSADLVPGMVDAIGSFAAPSNPWHHRLRIMVVIQVFYYRQLFVLSKHDRKRLFDAVIQLLNDAQLEVREAASSTLSGMVQCSKFDEKNIVLPLLERFKRGVIENPMPKRRPRGALSASGISTPQAMGINPSPPRSGATTPDIDLLRLNQDTQTLIRRHAAVLGLSSIITAFPYEMPEWMPSTLAFLANRASGDRGMIGMSVKKTLGDFKKTHQDTWSMDQKLFNEDELEALEGVFSSNYFA
jgi:proteasome activator subunit 4